MFTKILLIATFLLLAWSSYQVTNKNEYLKAQNTKIITLQHEIKEQQEVIIKNTDKQISKLALKLSSELTSQLKDSNAEANSAIKSILEKIKKIDVAVGKLKNAKVIKKSYPKKKPSVKAKPEAKPKPSAKAKPAAKPKSSVKAKPLAKPKPSVKPESEEKQTVPPKAKPNNVEAEQEMTKKLNTVIELHKQGSIDVATSELLAFKGLVWKNRKDERATKKTVLSVISSIDYTLKKWKEKEITYDLTKVNEKYKSLFSNKEASK